MRSSRQFQRPTLLVLGLLAFSLLPLPLKDFLGTTGRLHGAGHVAAFAILILGGFAWPYAVRDILIGTPLAVLLGISIELMEHIIYGGSFELRDVQTDLEGVLLGLLVVVTFLVRTEARRRRGAALERQEINHLSRPFGS